MLDGAEPPGELTKEIAARSMMNASTGRSASRATRWAWSRSSRVGEATNLDAAKAVEHRGKAADRIEAALAQVR